MSQLDLELPEPRGLRLVADSNRTQPTLWVRRLAVWERPGLLLREVHLRPGLNVVWSPDPADGGGAVTEGDDALGHGGGKTLFCRLLRYCLGENRFAPEPQWTAIANAFQDGLVGAEVFVNGTPWAVVRSIGYGNRHHAAPNVELDDLASTPGTSAGIGPLLDAIESEILSADVATLVSDARPRTAWLVALAWLTRDQQCRFAHPLAWRSPESESGSPARNLSITRLLEVARALLGALPPAEPARRAEEARLDKERQDAVGAAAHHERQASLMRRRLIDFLSLRDDEIPQGPLAVATLATAAESKLREVARGTTGQADLETLRLAARDADRAAADKSAELAAVEAFIPIQQQLITVIASDIPGLTVAIAGAKNPACELCEVPLDRVLVDGCRLSRELPDLDALRQRHESQVQRRAIAQRDLHEAQERLDRLRREQTSLRAAAEDLWKQERDAEGAQARQSEAWYSARRSVEDVERLDTLYQEQRAALGEADSIEAQLKKVREVLATLRNEHGAVFRHLSEVYVAIVRRLAERDAGGGVNLDGNGLHLTIERGGDSTATAIESLKVLIFDLATMCLSIEGRTHLPAFLVHDSPREADLGLSAYHRLFEFARELEGVSEQPLFQYIVTTTTRPPAEFTKAPWCCLEVRGAPADRRLLMRNL